MQRYPTMTLNGTLRLSDHTGRRTAGMFGKLINDNANVFRRYFGVELVAGSLNVDVPEPRCLQEDLDAGKPPPALVIPRTELINMPTYIGDGQAWRCELRGDKFPNVINCWIFRRKGSRVPPGVIELVACELLRTPYKLQHGDKVGLAIV
jgi:CTP-dependent riboflavin kinase